MKRHHILSLAVLSAFFGLCTLLYVQELNAQEAKPAKVLHFTRSQGFEHDPAKRLEDGTTVSGRGLTSYFADKNIEIVETQDGSVFDGDISQYDAFVFYTSGNLLNPDDSKNDFAKPMSEAGLRKMLAAVRAGKGFVGIHSATDTFSGLNEDGMDIYTKFVGARFTGHGPDQYGTLTVVQPTAFPFLKEAGPRFTTWDEWYGMGSFSKDMHVLLIQETAGMDGRDYNRPPFPMTWIRAEGDGRVAYTSFGHGNRYFHNMENVRRIGELVEWAVGRFNASTTPNIDAVTPGAGQMPPRRN
ncbi:MAG: ThuA domain-containing protein [Planctomycetaceae bacterium]|nr:ThuA domain-containing protein [Planctomycetaceae bacterium]